MKLALLTALYLPFVPAAVGENYVRTVIHELLGAEQLAAFETTSCTYFNINKEEGCAADEMCKIGVRNCLRRIRRQEGICYTRPEACTFDFNPVCGCDGVTYSNECSALGAGVNIMNAGCCSDDEECKDSLEPNEPTPVEPTPCTYFSVGDDEGCAAEDMCKIGVGRCRLRIGQQEGVCYTPPEICDDDFNPVCGCDGVTYSTECSALGAGVNTMNVGCCSDDEECKDSLGPDEPAPVEPTTCTYFNINSDEGCAADDMCKIGVGKCRLRIGQQEGVCFTPPEICAAVYDPVCGCDDITYSNDCIALNAGANIQNVGCCSDDKKCKDSLETDPAEMTPCTYYSVNDDEGCATGDMCKIGVGKCLLYSAWKVGVCFTPPEVCTADFDPVCGCDGVTYSNECKALGRGVNIQSAGRCLDSQKADPPSTPNNYRCFPGEQPAPICPGKDDDEYCDGGGDCEGSDFCDCQAGQDFCNMGINPCADINFLDDDEFEDSTPTEWPAWFPSSREG